VLDGDDDEDEVEEEYEFGDDRDGVDGVREQPPPRSQLQQELQQSDHAFAFSQERGDATMGIAKGEVAFLSLVSGLSESLEDLDDDALDNDALDTDTLDDNLLCSVCLLSTEAVFVNCCILTPLSSSLVVPVLACVH